MSQTRKAIHADGPSAQLVRALEVAVAHGATLNESDSELGARIILAKLRAAAQFAPAIAASGEIYEGCTDLAGAAQDAMTRAAFEVEGVELASGEDRDHSEDPHTLYLLGLAVGIELAGGLR